MSALPCHVIQNDGCCLFHRFVADVDDETVQLIDDGIRVLQFVHNPFITGIARIWCKSKRLQPFLTNQVEFVRTDG